VLSGVMAAARPSVAEAVGLYAHEGGDLSRLVLCHQDGSGDDEAYQEMMLGRGLWFAYDTFGSEGVFSLGEDYVQLPTDSQRIRELRRLIDAGFLSQLLVSHDIAYQSDKRAWGGWGYAHLLEVVRDRFRAGGINATAFETLLVRNPARLLAFASGGDATQPSG
jgi:phosphotriesterase-related protein